MRQFPLRRQFRSAWPYFLAIAIWLVLVGGMVVSAVHFILKFW